MAHIVATNVTSPLGMTTEENYAAVKAGRSMLRRYDSLPLHGPAQGQPPQQFPEPFCASLFTDEQLQRLSIFGMTRFESLVVRSVREALSQCPWLDVAAGNVIFILSTTKANVELLQSTHAQQAGGQSAPITPGAAAQRIAGELGFTTMPVVVCNACISGVAAIILARRLLDSRQYDYAVVSGADVQCPFTVAGFQSLKAVSADDCRPFDMERTGLNLGEAAATVVMTRGEEPGAKSLGTVEAGVIRNDAFHISSPSKNGEGAWLALHAALRPSSSPLRRAPSFPHPSSLTPHQSLLHQTAFINAHGTATMFNDQMESVAIERAGLSDLPVNGLKGCYGHTLGAAGILETIISLAALRDHTVLATRGFAERGVSGKISVTTENTATAEGATSFIKMISGFGGGNAAIVGSLPQPPTKKGSLPQPPPKEGAFTAASPLLWRGLGEASLLWRGLGEASLLLTPTEVTVNGRRLHHSPQLPTKEEPRSAESPLPWRGLGEAPLTLTDLYRQYVGDYPKFYKMDGLSRLGFIASELLLQAEREAKGTDDGRSEESTPNVSRAIVLFNSSSSIAADRKFQETIAPDNHFPSPSVFVYTLPNIVTGEIAMRNGYHGETSFFILPRRSDSLMRQIALTTLQDREVKSIITGWMDYYDETHYEADLILLTT